MSREGVLPMNGFTSRYNYTPVFARGMRALWSGLPQGFTLSTLCVPILMHGCMFYWDPQSTGHAIVMVTFTVAVLLRILLSVGAAPAEKRRIYWPMCCASLAVLCPVACLTLEAHVHVHHPLELFMIGLCMLLVNFVLFFAMSLSRCSKAGILLGHLLFTLVLVPPIGFQSSEQCAFLAMAIVVGACLALLVNSVLDSPAVISAYQSHGVSVDREPVRAERLLRARVPPEAIFALSKHLDLDGDNPASLSNRIFLLGLGILHGIAGRSHEGHTVVASVFCVLALASALPLEGGVHQWLLSAAPTCCAALLAATGQVVDVPTPELLAVGWASVSFTMAKTCRGGAPFALCTAGHVLLFAVLHFPPQARAVPTLVGAYALGALAYLVLSLARQNEATTASCESAKWALELERAHGSQLAKVSGGRTQPAPSCQVVDEGRSQVSRTALEADAPHPAERRSASEGSDEPHAPRVMRAPRSMQAVEEVEEEAEDVAEELDSSFRSSRSSSQSFSRSAPQRGRWGMPLQVDDSIRCRSAPRLRRSCAACPPEAMGPFDPTEPHSLAPLQSSHCHAPFPMRRGDAAAREIAAGRKGVSGLDALPCGRPQGQQAGWPFGGSSFEGVEEASTVFEKLHWLEARDYSRGLEPSPTVAAGQLRQVAASAAEPGGACRAGSNVVKDSVMGSAAVGSAAVDSAAVDSAAREDAAAKSLLAAADGYESSADSSFKSLSSPKLPARRRIPESGLPAPRRLASRAGMAALRDKAVCREAHARLMLDIHLACNAFIYPSLCSVAAQADTSLHAFALCALGTIHLASVATCRYYGSLALTAVCRCMPDRIGDARHCLRAPLRSCGAVLDLRVMLQPLRTHARYPSHPVAYILRPHARICVRATHFAVARRRGHYHRDCCLHDGTVDRAGGAKRPRRNCCICSGCGFGNHA